VKLALKVIHFADKTYRHVILLVLSQTYPKK